MNDEEQLQDDQYYFDLDSNSPEFSDIHSRGNYSKKEWCFSTFSTLLL